MTKPILLALAVASLLSLPQALRGVAIQSDACGYLSVAKNIAEGKGIVNFGGWKDLAHPPGLSLALAPLIRIGFAPADAAGFLNWLSLAGIFLLSWAMLTRIATTTRIRFTPPLRVASFNNNVTVAPASLAERVPPAAWLPLLGAGLATATPALLEAGQQGLSEAWFTFLGLAFVWAVMKGVER